MVEKRSRDEADDEVIEIDDENERGKRQRRSMKMSVVRSPLFGA